MGDGLEEVMGPESMWTPDGQWCEWLLNLHAADELKVRRSLGQVVNTHVPISPSSIIWYQPMVTVGLASHWPCVTDISGSPPTGSRPGRGR